MIEGLCEHCGTDTGAIQETLDTCRARLAEAERLLRVMPGYGLSGHDYPKWVDARETFLRATVSAEPRDHPPHCLCDEHFVGLSGKALHVEMDRRIGLRQRTADSANAQQRTQP